MSEPHEGKCPGCRTWVQLLLDGTMRRHSDSRATMCEWYPDKLPAETRARQQELEVRS